MEIGLKFEQEIKVCENMLAINVGSGEVSVLATPIMISFMENTSAKLVQDFIGEENVTVGVEVNIKHFSATPLNMAVKFISEITNINGKMISFNVSAYDEVDKIGEGTHARAIVNKEKFELRTNAK